MSFNKRPFKKFQRNSKPQTTDEKIKSFVIRNSKNGYFTKVSTLSYKFEISQDRAWEIVGELLDEDVVESIHDEHTGDMKLCEPGKTYSILNLEQKRKIENEAQGTMAMNGFGMRPGIILLREGTDTSQVCAYYC